MRARGGPKASLPAAGAAAVSPRVKGTELTGGVCLSVSRREEGRRRLTSGTRSSATAWGERARAQRGCGPEARGPACGPISRPSTAQYLFLFLFVQFLLYV